MIEQITQIRVELDSLYTLCWLIENSTQKANALKHLANGRSFLGTALQFIGSDSQIPIPINKANNSEETIKSFKLLPTLQQAKFLREALQTIIDKIKAFNSDIMYVKWSLQQLHLAKYELGYLINFIHVHE